MGDRDDAVIRNRGVDIAEECVRVLTTPAETLEDEFEGKQYPLPDAVMPR